MLKRLNHFQLKNNLGIQYLKLHVEDFIRAKHKAVVDFMSYSLTEIDISLVSQDLKFAVSQNKFPKRK